MTTVKLEGVGKERRTVRVYGADSLSEASALKVLIENRMEKKPLKVGDKIPAYKFYDTISSYKVSNICFNGDIELRAV